MTSLTRPCFHSTHARMKCIKMIMGVAVVVVLIALGAFMARPHLIRWAVEQSLASALGGDIEIGHLESSLRDARISIQDLRIINPADWPTDAEWIIQEITVVYDWRTLFSKTVRLHEVILDIQRISMTVDMNSMRSLQSAATGRRRHLPATTTETEFTGSDALLSTQIPHQEPSTGEQRKRSDRNLMIDQLEFRLGRIEMYNALFGEVEEEAVPIILNLEQTFYNVEDMDQIVQALTRSLLFTIPSMR